MHHTGVLKRFDYTVENKTDTHGGDKKPDDPRDRVNAHGPNPPKEVLGIGQA